MIYKEQSNGVCWVLASAMVCISPFIAPLSAEADNSAAAKYLGGTSAAGTANMLDIQINFPDSNLEFFTDKAVAFKLLESTKHLLCNGGANYSQLASLRDTLTLLNNPSTAQVLSTIQGGSALLTAFRQSSLTLVGSCVSPDGSTYRAVFGLPDGLSVAAEIPVKKAFVTLPPETKLNCFANAGSTNNGGYVFTCGVSIPQP